MKKNNPDNLVILAGICGLLIQFGIDNAYTYRKASFYRDRGYSMEETRDAIVDPSASFAKIRRIYGEAGIQLAYKHD